MVLLLRTFVAAIIEEELRQFSSKYVLQLCFRLQDHSLRAWIVLVLLHRQKCSIPLNAIMLQCMFNETPACVIPQKSDTLCCMCPCNPSEAKSADGNLHYAGTASWPRTSCV